MKIILTAAAICIAAGTALAARRPMSSRRCKQGYKVLFNSPSTMPLARCTVNGIHGLMVMMMPDGSLMMRMVPDNLSVVYVDLTCPNSNS